MEKDFSRVMNNLDAIYDDVSYHLKDYAALPAKYHDLTHDQRSFLDEFLVQGLSQFMFALKDEKENMKSIAKEMLDACKSILGEKDD